MRNHGLAFGYSLVGYKSLIKGLDKIDVNKEIIDADLNNVLFDWLFSALGSISWTNLNCYEKIRHG